MLDIKELKNTVHRLSNKMQMILGYVELEQFDKARTHVMEAAEELHMLGKVLSGTGVVVPMKDQTVALSSLAVVVPVETVIDKLKLSEEEEAALRRFDQERPDATVVVPFHKLIEVGHAVEIDTTKKPPQSET